MPSRSETGKLGEDLASRYLKSKGYRIIERNYRQPWGELDIVAYSETGVLVFVEVKTVTSHNVDKTLTLQETSGSITAEDQMTSQKIRKLKRVSATYAQNFPEKINEALGWRIDVLALTINGKDCVVKHYENIS